MKRFFIAVLFLVVFLTIYLLFDWYMREVFTVIAKEESAKALSNCLDEALSETIATDISYNDLVNIHQDKNGLVTLVQSNTVNMNILAGNATKKAEEKLNNKKKSGIDVPFGYLVGGQLFGESMPSVKVNFRQIGNVTSKFSSTFKDAGINQTLHTVNLTLKVDALLMVPNNNIAIDSEITIPVCETIIIGNVPSEYRKYMESGSGDDEDE